MSQAQLHPDSTRPRLLEAFEAFKNAQFNEALVMRRARLKQVQAALAEHLQACQDSKDSVGTEVQGFIAKLV